MRCTEPDEKTLCELGQTAYDETLAKHHPWVVRNAVTVAFHALPNRQQFIEKMVASQPAESQLTTVDICRNFLIKEGIPALKKAYDVTETIYKKYDMLELP
ncbi:unnamed protein product [Dibothriocephalus latus]|uniref:Glycolipid transfer protein domain-containing protein n=1 Tax=Dibothriocephalus latus TaxID=60516 RepID=A0A3P6Q9R1_DIBLA|nr:unnamed protein product [Dibothriocephalus latus]